MSSKTENKGSLNREKVYEFLRSQEPEPLTIGEIADHFDTKYRNTADFMKRHSEGLDAIFERIKDGRSWMYSIRSRTPIDVDTVIDTLIELCNRPENKDDHRVQVVLNNIGKKDGGNMSGGGYKYLIKRVFEVANEFNLI